MTEGGTTIPRLGGNWALGALFCVSVCVYLLLSMMVLSRWAMVTTVQSLNSVRMVA